MCQVSEIIGVNYNVRYRGLQTEPILLPKNLKYAAHKALIMRTNINRVQSPDTHHLEMLFDLSVDIQHAISSSQNGYLLAPGCKINFCIPQDFSEISRKFFRKFSYDSLTFISFIFQIQRRDSAKEKLTKFQSSSLPGEFCINISYGKI